MRILFLESHPMWIHGLPNGFCDAGHDVLVSGTLTENGIQDMVTRFRPDLIFALGHTPEHTEEKQQWVRKYVKSSGIPLVYWATEDPGYIHTFSLPLIKTIQPDFVFTICRQKVDFYQEQGFQAAHLDFGYHSSVHYPVQPDQSYSVNLAVVANGYPMLHKERPDHFRFQAMNRLLSPFLTENKRIDFWGRYWDQMSGIIGKPIPKEWIHGYLPYTEANKVYSSASLVLGIQNHLTQVTQRTYEILGSGGLLLTNDTPEVRRMFEPGEDLLVTSSADETVNLVNYYLNHPEERKEIVKSGMEKVKCHSYEQRALFIIQTLIQAGLLSIEKAKSKKGSLTDYPAMLSKEYQIYQVQVKDTLWSISKKTGISVEQIKRLNGLKTDLIYANQMLKLKEK